MPFYLYICVTATARRRLAMLAFGLFMVVALESLTLAIGWVLVVVVCSRGWLVPLGIAALSAIVLTQVNLTYFLDRLDFSDETTNLSTLVYLRGRQLVEKRCGRRRLGGGFPAARPSGYKHRHLTRSLRSLAQMQYSRRRLWHGKTGRRVWLDRYGYRDWSLNFLSIQSLLRLRFTARQPASVSRTMIFMNAVLASYLVEFLVRGTGYFSPTAILLVAALWLRHHVGKPVVALGVNPIAAS